MEEQMVKKDGSTSNVRLWDLVITKCINEVTELHERVFLQEAMEFSMLEHQQLQHHHNEGIHRTIERTNSTDLLKLQMEQLMVFQTFNNNDVYHYHPTSELRPASQQFDYFYRMQQDQLLVLRQEQELRARQQLERESQLAHEHHIRQNQAELDELQRKHDELQRKHEIQMRQQHEQQAWYLQDQQRRQAEEQIRYQQQCMYEEDNRLSALSQQQRYNEIVDAEHQQMLRLQQMEMEQERQQEQLRFLAEAQLRMEEGIRRKREECGYGQSTVDEDLDSALKLVEALQVQQHQPM
jgi:hypothetical protein